MLGRLALWVLVAVSVAAFAGERVRADVRIALLADPHCTPDPARAEHGVHFDRVIEQVNAEGVDVVLVAGDLTETLSEPAAKLFLGAARRFRAPVHYVGGNHDHGVRAVADKKPSLTDERVATYERLLGESFYAREVLPGLHVIGVATALMGTGTDAEARQWAFLDRELARPRPGTTLLLSHYPPFNTKPDEPDGYFNLPPASRQRLLPLLKSGGVRAVLSGHLHYPIDLKWDGIDILGAPPVSFGLPKNVTREGWKLVTLRDDGTILTSLREIPRATTQPAPQPATQPATRPASRPAADASPSRDVHIFYYNWYGAPPLDPAYVHWQQGGHTPPAQIGADYYPALGPYSSNDPAVLRQHMRWIRQAGAGVLTVSWWGRGSFEDRGLRRVLDAAAEAGLRVNVHLEPYRGATPASFADDVAWILATYGDHPAFYRRGARPMFYVFEALRHPAADWRAAIARLPAGPDRPLLIAQTSDLAFVTAAGFDGGYTYDVLAPFKDPQFLGRWPDLADRFRAAGKLFIPSVGPGYCDDRAVPTGADEPDAAKSRDAGADTTYERMWSAATAVNAPLVTITSFNEWHEGTQIEPAAASAPPTAPPTTPPTTPPAAPGYRTYRAGPDHYLEATARLARSFRPRQE